MEQLDYVENQASSKLLRLFTNLKVGIKFWKFGKVAASRVGVAIFQWYIVYIKYKLN